MFTVSVPADHNLFAACTFLPFLFIYFQVLIIQMRLCQLSAIVILHWAAMSNSTGVDEVGLLVRFQPAIFTFNAISATLLPQLSNPKIVWMWVRVPTLQLE